MSGNTSGATSMQETRHISASLPHFSVFAVMEYNKSFADVPVHHWANQTIRTLAAKHIVQGVTESEFAPQQDVTRAEFTTLLVRMLGLQQSNAAHAFTDIPSAAWYADDVAAAYEAGVVRGSSGNRFIPNGVISRQEMAAMLVRAYDYAGGQQTNGQATSYTDQEKIAGWAVQDVTRATEIGLLMGHNGMFRPEATTTRAEAAQAILQLVDIVGGLTSKSEPPHNKKPTNRVKRFVGFIISLLIADQVVECT